MNAAAVRPGCLLGGIGGWRLSVPRFVNAHGVAVASVTNASTSTAAAAADAVAAVVTVYAVCAATAHAGNTVFAAVRGSYSCRNLSMNCFNNI